MIRTALALLALVLLLAACSSSGLEEDASAEVPALEPLPAGVFLESPTPTNTSSTTSTTAAPTTTTTSPPPPPAPTRAAGPCGGLEELVAAHFDDVPKACSVMRCETGGTFDPTIENPRSTASGLFQFLDSTWIRARALVGADRYARAAHAPASVQIAAAGAWLRATSWSQWVCA